MFKRFLILLMLGAGGLTAPVVTQAALHCDFDSASMVTTLFDFSQMPTGINASAEVGTVLYTKSHTIPIWCAKDGTSGSSITSGAEPIYISRPDVSNAFGSQSGLTLYITINGNRGNKREAIATGLSSSYLWVPSLPTSAATHFSIDVTIELVKTAENKTLSVKNTVELFEIGNQFDGDMKFYMKNGNKLVFTTQTCDVVGDGNYTANLPPLNVSNVKTTGPVDGHTVDVNVQLSCNSTLWSTQAIMMQLTGWDVPGSASDGLFYFKDLDTGSNADGIVLQMFQGARGQPFTPVTVGQGFEVGNFEDGQSVVTVPLRAGYYSINRNMSPGKLQSVLIYQIDYK